MSELKHFVIGIGKNLETNKPILIATDNEGNARLLNGEVYFKSEADNVIAELEAEIRNLRRSLIVTRHEVAKARGKNFSNKRRAKFKEAK